MKARVKETGKEFKVRGILTPTADAYATEEVDLFFDESDQVELLHREDYWTRLEHQAAIAAMQGLMSKEYLDNPDSLVSHAIHYAHALVEKIKEERK